MTAKANIGIFAVFCSKCSHVFVTQIFVMSSHESTSQDNMSNCRKRKFSDVSNAMSTASKKRRIDPKTPRSKEFSNVTDHKQFVEIFQSLTKTELITELSVPKCIIKEIAEQTVGQVRDCEYDQCDNKVVILRQDNIEKDEEYFYPEHESYDHIYSALREIAEFYCIDCKKGIIYCDDCRQVVFAPLEDRADCAICGHQMRPHYGECHHMTDFAVRTLKFECTICGETVCSECLCYEIELQWGEQCCMCAHAEESSFDTDHDKMSDIAECSDSNDCDNEPDTK